jgi:hypothetical protein
MSGSRKKIGPIVLLRLDVMGNAIKRTPIRLERPIRRSHAGRHRPAARLENASKLR